MVNEHECTFKPGSETWTRLEPPNQFYHSWRLVTDSDTVKIRFCPWCGQDLMAKPRRGAEVDVKGIIPGLCSDYQRGQPR